MAQNCLSIVVALLHDPFHSGIFQPTTGQGPIPLPYDDDDPNNTYDYEYFLNLETVTKVSIDRNPVMDEGDVKVLYIDHVVTVEAVLTQDMKFGYYIDGPPPSPPPPFNERLEKIGQFLNNQGLAVHFVNYPTPIEKMIPGNENNDPVVTGELAEFRGNNGWMIDNFNGPKTVQLTMESLSGSESCLLTWKVKFRTSHTQSELTQNTLIPKISSELRLDIGEDGDLVIIVDGTIYADSLAAIYKARDWLEIQYQPGGRGAIITSDSTYEEGKWTMVNGFKKTSRFNIEKNGRTARFDIRYTQIKSNNAYPLAIRDISFIQSLESNLLGKNFWNGIGFRSWKDTFKAKITIPPRLSSHYVWFVMHLLVQQQMRNAEMTFESIIAAAGGEGAEDPEAAETSTDTEGKEKIRTSALPLKLKIRHNHFARTLHFEFQFVLISPLSKVLTTSCIFARINNDFLRSVTEPSTPYVPLTLSEQWFGWNESNDLSNGFDPTQPNATNNGTPGRPHRDIAGVEVLDTGHNYDPYKQLQDQSKQKNVLVSTVFDPNEKDPLYNTPDTTQPEPTEQYDVEPLVPFRSPGDDTNNFAGNKPHAPTRSIGIKRYKPQIDPKISWVHYKQDYTIHETNPTVPTESLADISVEDFQNRQLYDELDLEGKYALDTGGSPAGIDYANRTTKPKDFEAYTGWFSHGRKNQSESEKEDTYKRKTYATSPPRYYLTVRGVAIRVKHKIPMPSVIVIAGERATRVGTGRFRHINIGGDNDIPIYMALWEQTYTVDKSVLTDDILKDIEDSGANMLYA